MSGWHAMALAVALVCMGGAGMIVLLLLIERWRGR